MISIDVRSIAKSIYESNEYPDSRKPFFAMVTGMGRGKTRTLVSLDEIFRKEYTDILSIPITFNHKWCNIIESFPNDKGKSFVLNVIARIISIYYRLDFDDCQNKFLINTKFIKLCESIPNKLIYEEFFRFVIRQARTSGIPFRYLVLMIDESLEAEKYFGKAAIQEMRNLFLNTQLMEPTEEPVCNELIMSSLTISPLGLAPSKRFVKPISLPEELNVSEILTSWIPIYKNITFDSEFEKQCFLQFLSIFASIPRAIEMLISTLPSNTTFSINSHNMKNVYEKTLHKFQSRYGTCELEDISPELIYSLLFKKQIPIDSKIMEYITQDIFVNSFYQLIPSETQYFIPVSSMISFEFLSHKISFISNIKRAIKTVIDGMLNLEIDSLDKPLEVISNALIDSKLEVVHSLNVNRDQNTKIIYPYFFELFHISRDILQNMSVNLHDILRTSILIGEKTTSEDIMDINLNDSHQVDPETFLEECNNIILTEKHSFIKLNLHQQEFANGGWLLRTYLNESFALFTTHDAYVNPQLPEQALYLTNLVNKTSKNNLKKNSLADALAHGRYLMVFINSNENVQTYEVNSHCLTLGGNQVKSFLSFFYTFSRLFPMTSVKKGKMKKVTKERLTSKEFLRKEKRKNSKCS